MSAEGLTTNAQGTYRVEKVGTPDPDGSQYVVLNLVHDFEARVAVAKLLSAYEARGQTAKAQECKAQLEGTMDAHKAAMIEKTRRSQGDEKKPRGRPPSSTTRRR